MLLIINTLTPWIVDLNYSYTIHGTTKAAIFIYIIKALFKYENSSFQQSQIEETKCHKQGDTL